MIQIYDDLFREIFDQSGRKQSKLIVVSRWILVFPCAVLGFGIVSLIGEGILEAVTLWDTSVEIIRNCIIPMLGGAGYIYVGMKTTPSHHKIAAYVLIAILVINLGNSVYNDLFNNKDFIIKEKESNYVDDIFLILGASASAFIIFSDKIFKKIIARDE